MSDDAGLPFNLQYPYKDLVAAKKWAEKHYPNSRTFAVEGTNGWMGFLAGAFHGRQESNKIIELLEKVRQVLLQFDDPYGFSILFEIEKTIGEAQRNDDVMGGIPWDKP